MKSGRLSRGLLISGVIVGMLSLTPLASAALDPGGTFSDDNGSLHEGAIEAIADEGITRGCNPPANTLYCPSSTVTREQMASFLVRALDLPAGSASFTDIDSSIHKSDIAALAAVGVTKGCNPPVNTLYCPSSRVTREQMASFLVRALDLPAGTSSFTDIDSSIHKADIAALAAAGITAGCNPPANTLYCPRDPVTREQMASFLARALDLDPITPPPPLPAVSPNAAVVIGLDSWLYLAETLDQTCNAATVYDRLIVEIENTREVVEASGRDFVYTVPPNKATIYPDTVPAGTWAASCADENSAALYSALNAAGHPDYADLLVPFQAATEQLYYKHDTHWNVNGTVFGSELISDWVATGVWDQADLVASSASRAGDLAGLVGVNWIIDYEELTPTFAGVTTTDTVESETIAGRPLVSYTGTPGMGLSAQPTAIIHDSMGLFFRNKLGPLFEQAAFVPNFSHPITDAARPFVVDSEQIVLEVVERNVLRDFIGAGTAGHLAAALADDFAQTSVSFTRVGQEVDFTIPAGDPTDLRYLIVVTDAASTVIIDDLNDVGIDLSVGAWPNEITPDASRYGFEIVVSGGSMQLPLPTSVDVTDAFVVVIE